MNNVGGRALILALLVVSVAGPGGIALTGSTAAADGEAVQRVAVQQSDADDAANATPSHRNPDGYSEKGDLEKVKALLADRLSSRLEEGAVQLSQGEYDRASEYVDEEYRRQLEQYVEVAGQTGGESQAEQFEKAGEQQAALSAKVEAYRETKAKYDAAREAGDDERARKLARELERLAAEIDALSASVRQRYDRIERETGSNLSESERAVQNVTTDVRTDQAAVREREFDATELTLSPRRETISFREPLVASGELRTANGSPVANTEIRLAVGNHTERVTTDATGAFTLEYRPTDESLSTDELTVRYAPETQSPYLGDEATVNVSIEQVEPTVALRDFGEPVAYGDNVTVAGNVTVGDVPVDNVTLVATLAGERIGTANVTDGTFDTTAPVPASVPDGAGELRVRLPFEAQALAATADATTLTVSESESELSIEGTAVTEETILVNGTLATAGDGNDGIGGETVRVRIGGTTVGTLTTAADGSFGGTVSVPDSAGGDEVRVAAAYDGRGSNLEPATANTVITVGDAGLRSSVTWLAGGFVAVIAAGLGVWWYRRSPDDDSPPSVPERDREIASDGESGAGGPAASDPSPPPVELLLGRAREQLSDGRPDEAARTGYAAARRALASRIGERDSLTHWEFYRRYRAADAPDADLLREVTQDYERAAFGPGGVSSDDAASAFERARRLCDLDEPTADDAPADD